MTIYYCHYWSKSSIDLSQALFTLAEAGYRYGSPWSLQVFRNDLKQVNQRYLIALDQAEIVGFIGYTTILDEVEITNFVLRKDYQQQGNGRKLYEFFEQINQQNGIQRLLLEVRQQNQKAVKFYLKQGFRINGSRENYYSSPQDHAWLMEKKY